MWKKCIVESRKGFTLVELIIVIAIISIITAVFVPTYYKYIEEAKGSSAVSAASDAYYASVAGLIEWETAGSPGNGDNAYKINIELEIAELLEFGEMKSHTETKETVNAVQVGLSLPSYFSQGWQAFIKECTQNDYRNFVRVWIGKKLDGTVGDSIKAVYYISADGLYAARIVNEGTTKLGSVDQRTGVYYERILK